MKRIYLILGFTILFIIIVMIVNNIFKHKYPEKSEYLNYLNNRYNKEFIIESKIEDTSDIIDDSYCQAYNCSLKSNDNIKFIVGYGKIKPEVWSISKYKMFFDTYEEAVRNYLQNKYFQTITIEDGNHMKTDEIQKIYEQEQNEWKNYGAKFSNCTLIINIIYDGKLIENVEIYNYNRILDTLWNAIQK